MNSIFSLGSIAPYVSTCNTSMLTTGERAEREGEQREREGEREGERERETVYLNFLKNFGSFGDLTTLLFDFNQRTRQTSALDFDVHLAFGDYAQGIDEVQLFG